MREVEAVDQAEYLAVRESFLSRLPLSFISLSLSPASRVSRDDSERKRVSQGTKRMAGMEDEEAGE